MWLSILIQNSSFWHIYLVKSKVCAVELLDAVPWVSLFGVAEVVHIDLPCLGQHVLAAIQCWIAMQPLSVLLREPQESNIAFCLLQPCCIKSKLWVASEISYVILCTPSIDRRTGACITTCSWYRSGAEYKSSTMNWKKYRIEFACRAHPVMHYFLQFKNLEKQNHRNLLINLCQVIGTYWQRAF